MADAILGPIQASGAITGAPEKVLTFSTGRLAGLADGAVVGQLGDTVLLVTATAARSVREGIDF
jgi:polyribonucleotide nucleotidyltransferase